MPDKDSAGTDLARFPFAIYAFLLGLLGLSSFGVLGTRDQTPQPIALAPAQSETAGQKQQPDSGKEADAAKVAAPLQPLVDSLGLNGPPTRDMLAGKQLDFLIATIPDPDTISYASYTNLAIESIMRAAESVGYGFDRHWIPWIGTPPEASTKSSRPRDNQPGTLLFRKGSSRLVVFLAGESPTAGIHMPAYLQAAQWIRSLSDQNTLKVLGPTFSGSAESLRRANQEAADLGFIDIQIVSGSATGPNVGAILCPDHFRAALPTDPEVHEELVSFYRTRLGGEAPVAILGESGTEYSPTSIQKNGNRSKNQNLSYTFPMQISRVREAYLSDPMLRDFGRTATSSSQPQTRTELELKLAQASGGYDKIPDWAKDLSAKSQELVLRRVVEEVEEARPRLIELFASDIRDVLFVGAFVRLNANKARIVVFDNDVLYSSKGAAYSLEGSLSAASYPLFNRSESNVFFPSQMAQGFYDAGRLLLSASGSTGETRPIWLTVFSAGENWPVALLRKTKDATAESAMEELPRRLKRVGRLWILVNVFLCCLSAATLYYWPFCQRTIWRDKTPEFAVLRGILQGALLVLVAAFFGINERASAWEPVAGGMLAGICFATLTFLFLDLLRNSIYAAILAAVPGAWAALIPQLSDSLEKGYFTGHFYAARALQLASGVSPALPLAVALLILAGSAFVQTFVQQTLQTAPPLGQELCAKFDLRTDCHDRNRLLSALRLNLVVAAVWSLLAVPLGRLYALDTLESLPYSVLMMAVLCALHFVIAFSLSALTRIAILMIVLFRNIERVAAKGDLHALSDATGLRHWMRASETTLRQREVATEKLTRKMEDLATKQQTDATKSGIDAAKLELESLHLATFLETLVFAARRAGYFLAAALVAMAAIFHWYPFQPASTLIDFAGIAYLVVGAALLILFLRLEQLKTRSPLYKAEAAGISWLAILRFASTFGAPFLAIAGTLLPQYGRNAFQWILFLANSAK